MPNNFCVKNLVACSFSSVRRKPNLLVVLTKVFPRKKTNAIGAFPWLSKFTLFSWRILRTSVKQTHCNLPSKEAWALFASVKRQKNLAKTILRLSAKSQGQKPFEVSDTTAISCCKKSKESHLKVSLILPNFGRVEHSLIRWNQGENHTKSHRASFGKDLKDHRMPASDIFTIPCWAFQLLFWANVSHTIQYRKRRHWFISIKKRSGWILFCLLVTGSLLEVDIHGNCYVHCKSLQTILLLQVGAWYLWRYLTHITSPNWKEIMSRV